MSNKVSVITPIFNGEKYISNCYRNLLEQSEENWEWIVVDDGSSDNTLSMLNEISDTDARVRVFALGENKGRGYARNKALSFVRGEYVAIWDVDDLHTPEHLATALSNLTDGFDYYGGSAYLVNEDFSVSNIRKSSSDLLIHPALVIRSSFFEENKYVVNRTIGGIGEDYYVILRLLYSCSGFFDPVPTTYYFEFADINLTKSFHSHLIRLKTFLLVSNIPLRRRIFAIIKSAGVAFFLAALHLLGANLYKNFVKHRKRDVLNSRPNYDLLNFEARYGLTRVSIETD
jgi:glycosyltransferase involved in cell wall biosynthesis